MLKFCEDINSATLYKVLCKQIQGYQHKNLVVFARSLHEKWSSIAASMAYT